MDTVVSSANMSVSPWVPTHGEVMIVQHPLGIACCLEKKQMGGFFLPFSIPPIAFLILHSEKDFWSGFAIATAGFVNWGRQAGKNIIDFI